MGKAAALLGRCRAAQGAGCPLPMTGSLSLSRRDGKRRASTSSLSRVELRPRRCAYRLGVRVARSRRFRAASGVQLVWAQVASSAKQHHLRRGPGLDDQHQRRRNGAGWPNTNGQDVAFVKALYAQATRQLCFDREPRVLRGHELRRGIMSDTLRCQMGDVFRRSPPCRVRDPASAVAARTARVKSRSGCPTATTHRSCPRRRKRRAAISGCAANHCQMTSMPSPRRLCRTYGL